jgi:hypothetical protein
MKILKYLLLIGILCSCTNNKTTKEPVPAERTEDYYRSKGYQVFKEYQFAVKCPATLQDIAKQGSGDFDFHYAGHTDDTFYQIMIIKMPAGRADWSKEEEETFMRSLFNSHQGGKSVLWGEENLQAYLFNDYDKEGFKGRGIAVARNGRIYAFNVITKRDLSSTFNAFTNNVYFLDKLEKKTDKVQKPDAIDDNARMKTYTKSGVGSFSINYPRDWEIIENPNSIACVFVRAPKINGSESKANFNIIVSNDAISLETKFSKAQEQCKNFMPEYSLLQKNYVTVDGMQCIQTLSKSKIQDVNINTVGYQFKKSDNTVYTVVFTVHAQNYSEYVTVFDEIIKSFKTI